MAESAVSRRLSEFTGRGAVCRRPALADRARQLHARATRRGSSTTSRRATSANFAGRVGAFLADRVVSAARLRGVPAPGGARLRRLALLLVHDDRRAATRSSSARGLVVICVAGAARARRRRVRHERCGRSGRRRARRMRRRPVLSRLPEPHRRGDSAADAAGALRHPVDAVLVRHGVQRASPSACAASAGLLDRWRDVARGAAARPRAPADRREAREEGRPRARAGDRDARPPTPRRRSRRRARATAAGRRRGRGRRRAAARAAAAEPVSAPAIRRRRRPSPPVAAARRRRDRQGAGRAPQGRLHAAAGDAARRAEGPAQDRRARAAWTPRACSKRSAASSPSRAPVVQIHPGPVVTTYEFKPDAGVKYSRITGLADDLCLAMQAESVLIDRIPGKSTVGIQIPNPHREPITLRELLESDTYTRSTSRAHDGAGQDDSRRAVRQRPGDDAAPAHRRIDRRRQVGQRQRDDQQHPLPLRRPTTCASS